MLVGAGSWAWIALGSRWAVPAVVVYAALCGVAADPRWHECGHGTAFRTSWLNELACFPASFMLLREPTVWRWSHVRHHSDTIVVGRDAETIFPRPIDVRAWGVNLFGLTSVPAMVRRIVRHARGRPDGAVVGDELECPKHNGRFRLADGSPTRQPVTEGLAAYEVQVDVDWIRVRSVPNQTSGSTPV